MIVTEVSWTTAAEGSLLAVMSIVCLHLLLPVSFALSYANPLAACR
eukprot:CAMPEP_0117690624 /NCGR_PEP_ID=MMETSP0804-20121206/25231_1 /TAXON_ID=1074897 /ORGANISM="Tetraselmis astigmatica, Strain CCMP880" /LENGTH=45 /DNA_ID= /DNA_START= /DNA_END= /DNA_ORIENTATION=